MLANRDCDCMLCCPAQGLEPYNNPDKAAGHSSLHTQSGTWTSCCDAIVVHTDKAAFMGCHLHGGTTPK